MFCNAQHFVFLAEPHHKLPISFMHPIKAHDCISQRFKLGDRTRDYDWTFIHLVLAVYIVYPAEVLPQAYLPDKEAAPKYVD